MAPGTWRWLPVFICCLLPGVAGASGAGGTPPDAAGLRGDARDWLLRIQSAAHGGNYQGTMVFSIDGTMSSARVGHYAVGDQTFEELEALDGRQQRVLRHNDAVQTIWPQTRLTVLERRETLAAWSTTPQEVDPQALAHYELRREGEARVAGRRAIVFLLEPRDALRYPQRLWADEASGLMLRADVIGLAASAGAPVPVLESTAFSEVAIHVRPQPEPVLQAMRDKLDGYRIVRPQQQRTSLDAEGWAWARPVPGFQLAGCVRRGMETAGDDEAVLQAVFTDGLTHVSIFIEPYRPQRHRSEMQSQHGATATLARRAGAYWFTVVGDVPPSTLHLFAEGLDRRK